ncbi:MAG: DMT family transporter [Candidatus Promineifilaceae bacterium]|nr:DMT family transporter [Candidatus Promineifilaceae bacterium]
MFQNLSPRFRAILLALFVTFLWSTSWVLIKFGLEDIPPVTFAGLRFFLAFLVLIPFYLRSSAATPLRQLTGRDWASLLGLGLLYYTITQGTMFVTLTYLPAITFSMLLNGTAVVVAVLGIPLLRELPTRLQWLGMLIFFSGVLLFFYPWDIPAALFAGYFFAAVHILANSLSAVVGRGINRQMRIHPVTVTIVSMGIGSIVMLGIGLVREPTPHLDWRSWAIIAWLAVVNTALTFTLWNLTQRTLTAVESSVINNTMLIQISILAVIFLDATLTWIELVGLALAAVGALLVQLRRRKQK